MRRREMAALMQRAEAGVVGAYLLADPALAGRMEAAVRRLAGVVCLSARRVDEPFLNRALGVGTIADATPELLERVERHYATIGKPSRITIPTGYVGGATVRALERRGYAPVEGGVAVYAYDRSMPPVVPRVAGLVIASARAGDAALYARISFESFPERGEGFMRIIEALVRRRPRALRAYLGRIDGAAAATGMVFDAGPVAALANGSVLARYRGRGIQRAMIAHRIRESWGRGVRLFFSETQDPASAHNLERTGFRKLYDEVDWERPTARRAADP